MARSMGGAVAALLCCCAALSLLQPACVRAVPLLTGGCARALRSHAHAHARARSATACMHVCTPECALACSFAHMLACALACSFARTLAHIYPQACVQVATRLHAHARPHNPLPSTPQSRPRSSPLPCRQTRACWWASRRMVRAQRPLRLQACRLGRRHLHSAPPAHNALTQGNPPTRNNARTPRRVHHTPCLRVGPAPRPAHEHGGQCQQAAPVLHVRQQCGQRGPVGAGVCIGVGMWWAGV